MKPLRGLGPACALVLLAADAGVARAAWNNVFQVCCNSCSSQPAVANYAANYGAAPDPCCNPCPQPVCTTRYVQRCYYQPVTCYQTKTYYEPVTTYRTSYYYEPVTSYRYSCYYDPCTCSYQQVACPTTCYRLRSQCCPVQSWVQRCCQVPVTSYRVASYWEPQTTCCQPQTPCCPTSLSTAAACPPNGTAAPAAPPAPAASPTAPPPGVTEQRTPAGVGAGAGVQELPQRGGSGSPLFDRYYPPQTNPPAHMPGVEGSSLRQPLTLPPIPRTTPTVRLDRVVSAPRADLNGQVLIGNAPRPNARVLFVSAARGGSPQQVMADGWGRFRVTLASGGWLVYVNDAQEKPVFHSKIDLRESENRQVTLVARQ